MQYYIVENEKPTGPFGVQELVARGIKGSDLVWTEGLTEWVPAEKVEELRAAIYSGQCNNPYTGNQGMPPYNPPQTPPNFPPFNQFQVQPQQPPYQGQQNQYYQQGQPQQQQYVPYPYDIPPKSWLLESILVTIFCCLPFGIVGIIKASSVSSLWASGHRDEAYKASNDAKKWTLIGLIVGIVWIIVSMIFSFSGAFLNLMTNVY